MVHVRLTIVLVLLVAHLLAAQTTYRLPPAEVVDIIDAKPPPSVVFSPDTQWMLLVQYDAMPSIADVSRRMLRLAGTRIDPVANGRFRTDYARTIALRQRDNDVVVEIPLADARIGSVSWAHDSRSFVFTQVADTGTELWYASVDDPRHPRRLSDRLTTLMGGYEWMPDAKGLLCWTVPAERGAEPAAPSIPTGPNIQESSGNASPTRTYQDLLSRPFDEELFEYFAKAQLAVIDIEGMARTVGRPAIISEASVSPNGEHLLVTTIDRPFSYLMTYPSFPQRIEVWDLNGKAEHLVADVPMAENIPIEGVRTGPRRVVWKASEPATLLWLEALDGGDPNRDVDHRDRWMVHEAPFDQNPRELLLVEHRGTSVAFFDDSSLLITTEYDRDRRWTRTLLHDLSNQDQPAQVLDDRSVRDRYADPGRFVRRRDERGRLLVRRDGPWCYRVGAGASPDGLLPFLDRLDLETLQTERLWRCTPGSYESFVAMAESSPGELPTFVTSHETHALPPNFKLRNLEDETTVALTTFPDPTPQIRGIRKKLITYERDDGVPLSATLYLPADYQPGTRLPLIVWAYPREYNDPQTAGQIGTSDSRFTRMQGSTHLALLTQGYAIMDGATMPIIGDPETMNDTFIEQIVASAQAAIDAAVELGVADRNRVGVGGHSYGAFMTANLLAHCDLFHAGVARSGAYNRTLTPFGFQSERRPLWQAKSVYFQISPFMHAHQIDEPMLLIHGENDNNSGTFPMQSRRMYQAVKGNGGTVRLVMLPNESHGYRARESVLHVQAEMIEWFDQYVKNRSAAPELEDGFRWLFDGQSLSGWVQHGGRAKYHVEGGLIVGTSVADTPNSFLCTERHFGDFVLELEFKVDPLLNSGVQIRSQVFDKQTEIPLGNGRTRTVEADRVHGYQVEIDPSERAWSGGIYDEARRGWLNDLKKNEAARKAFKQNQWNHFRIECKGDSIKTWLNGVSAADLTDGLTRKGLIALQVHGVGDNAEKIGKQVRWRHIRIKELD